MESLSSKVSMKYQITLPRQVRDTIKIKAGDRVVFVKDGSKISLVRLDDLMGEVLDSFSDLEETEKEFRNGFRMQEIDDVSDIGDTSITGKKIAGKKSRVKKTTKAAHG